MKDKTSVIKKHVLGCHLGWMDRRRFGLFTEVADQRQFYTPGYNEGKHLRPLKWSPSLHTCFANESALGQTEDSQSFRASLILI